MAWVSFRRPAMPRALLEGPLGRSGIGRALGAIETAAIIAVVAMVLTDVTSFWSQPLRDLALYVKAGDAFMAGAPVYARDPLAEVPTDLSNYPFLYPPV